MSTGLFGQLQTTLGAAYQLERELGGGGMSRVFLAHETALGRKVVVKVLLPELAAGVSIDRFRREIQLAAQLQHPHIVPLLAAGESEGLPYFTMPFITGESLRARLVRQGELPVIESVRILRGVASALAYAHASGITHRDVKPDNVLLTGGVAVVTDFGVAKAVSASASSVGSSNLTSVGVALGTPAYMAPEQAAGDPHVDHRADIYAFGAMTYEMLTGRTPFSGRAMAATLAAHVIEAPEPIARLRPAVPPTLAALVMRCLAKHPSDRPQSATEVLHVLDAITTPATGTASTKAVTPARMPVAGSRRPWVLAIGGGAAAAVVLVAAALLWWRSASRPVTPADTSVAPVVAGPAPVPDSVAAARRSPGAAAREPTPQPRRQRPTEEARIEAPTEDAAPGPRAKREAASVPAPSVAAAAQQAPLPGLATESAPTPAPAPPSSVAVQPASPAPPETPPDPRPEIRGVLAAYVSAIESRNLDNLRRAYPGMTEAQQRGWEQFFQTVRDVKAQLSVAQLDVSNDAAEAQMTGTYTYLNSSTQSTERQPVAFHASLRHTPGGWRIAEIR